METLGSAVPKWWAADNKVMWGTHAMDGHDTFRMITVALTTREDMAEYIVQALNSVAETNRELYYRLTECSAGEFKAMELDHIGNFGTCVDCGSSAVMRDGPMVLCTEHATPTSEPL